MGGVLGRHWHGWQTHGAEDWTVEIFCIGHLVPFCHLPPLAREPMEFPFYGLGCSGTSGRSGHNAGKGSLEIVGNQCLGF